MNSFFLQTTPQGWIPQRGTFYFFQVIFRYTISYGDSEQYIHNIFILYMSLDPKFLAEGAFGCVHRPSLRCNKSKKIDYKNKISKVMTTKNANKEMREYVLIDRVDPSSKYYLGKPDTCKFEKSDMNDPAVNNCKIGKRILESSDNYELIVMKDGGDNLEEFVIKMKKEPDNASNRRIMTQFWTEAKRLFLGVESFIGNNIIHHDLKPQNIVYNTVTNRCNFIDFGMMENITRSKFEARRNAYGFAYYHWNFPTESIFLNAAEFLHYSELTTTEKMNYCLKMFKKNNDQMAYLYEYTMKKTYDKKHDYINEWSNFFLHAIGRTTYDQFLNRCFETYDVFGLGISLLHVLENTKHLIHETKYLKLQHLFNFMISPNMADRVTIEEAIHIYEDCLSSTPAELEKEEKSEIELEKNINEIAKHINTKIPNMKIMANMDPKPIIKKTKSKSPKKCPPGNVLNPKTNRCNKIKIPKDKTLKICPAGKVLNPKTNRCNKISEKKSVVGGRTRKNKICRLVQGKKETCCINPKRGH